MNPKQHSVKTVAVALAAMFAVIIIGGIILGAKSILAIVSPDSGSIFTNGSNYDNVFDKDSFSKIVIVNSAGRLILKPGDELRVSGQNLADDFFCEIVKDSLVIEHSSKHGKNFSKTSITVTVPDNYALNLISIENGMDDCDIDNIEVSEFILTAGVGDVTISGLVSSDTDIDGGVGDINIADSELGNFKLECGVGDIDIEGSVADCSIHTGVGDASLKLHGDFDDYDIDISTGIGDIRINGRRYSKNSRINKGAEYNFTISGGVGDIDVNFQ